MGRAEWLRCAAVRNERRDAVREAPRRDATRRRDGANGVQACQRDRQPRRERRGAGSGRTVGPDRARSKSRAARAKSRARPGFSALSCACNGTRGRTRFAQLEERRRSRAALGRRGALRTLQTDPLDAPEERMLDTGPDDRLGLAGDLSAALLLESGREAHAQRLAMTRRTVGCVVTAAVYLLATLASFTSALVRGITSRADRPAGAR